MSNAIEEIHGRAWDFWLARASVALIAVLQLLLINRLGLGPRWLAPSLEIALLIPLSIGSAWTERIARTAKLDEHRRRVARLRRWVRRTAMVLTALISVVNAAALINLIHALAAHLGAKTGQTLLLDAINLWLTNVVVFALWFWNIDRGGPAAHGVRDKVQNDFLFPQMTRSWAGAPESWTPGFIDYVFVSFTNAAAFSPTDTLPLSGRAKVLMMCQAAISLLTLALVAGRAVNILT